MEFQCQFEECKDLMSYLIDLVDIYDKLQFAHKKKIAHLSDQGDRFGAVREVSYTCNKHVRVCVCVCVCYGRYRK